MKFAVLGAGGWGTAMARLLARNGHAVILWARDPVKASAIDRTRENRIYLPGVALPRDNLTITADLATAMAAEVIVTAVPSFGMAALMERAAPYATPDQAFINLAKGLDPDSGRTMSEVIRAHVPDHPVFTLSGPSHAEEVGRDMPTAVVLAGIDRERGSRLQTAIMTPRFRVYLSRDIRGVELCGTVKNIIAIAVGVADGLGYGDNSRGALIARGLVELVRFGRAFGARDATFFGLAGLGDLVATATSLHSRNRYVGYHLGRGESLAHIMAGMKMVAEGVYAVDTVVRLAQNREVDMPITTAVHRLMHGEVTAAALVDEIMTRPPKEEGVT